MRTVTIKHGRSVRYDDGSPFILQSGAFELLISLPAVSGEFYLVTDMNGKKATQRIPKGGVVTVEVETGELKAEVKHYLRGVEVARYPVEPLIIKSVDERLTAFPEIADLYARAEALKRASEAQEKRMTEEETAHRKWQEAAKAAAHRGDIVFLSYAYSEYQNDVQLNEKNLTAEEFIVALGFSLDEFTQKEIEEIKKKKEVF